MKQRPDENARLYAARYEVIHYRANQLTAEVANTDWWDDVLHQEPSEDHLEKKATQEDIHLT